MSRSQNKEFQQWWNNQRDRSHDVLYAGDDESFLTVEICTPAVDPDKDRIRSRTFRQLSRLYLLKFKQIASSFVWIANSFVHLLRTANSRIANDNPPSVKSSTRLYRLIKIFLVVVILLLCFELAAYFKGWHFTPPSVASAEVAVEVAYAWWLKIRSTYLAPPLQSLINVCIILFLIQSVDRLVLVLGCFWIKIRRIKPVASMEYSAKPVGEGTILEDYPMVLVQIPMCNEKEVYQQSIGAVCMFDWPKERMLIQILDDSSDLDVQVLIKNEVQKWQQRGIPIVYRHRLIRAGYKAGNLKAAMNCEYVKDYEFVAIFDADFQPPADFLKKTVPHFKVINRLSNIACSVEMCDRFALSIQAISWSIQKLL